jgi:hypothetical protein
MIVVTGSNGDLPLATSALAVLLWGYFLYVGVVDPFGGIWTLWPLFGTANQMLAAIALTLCTVVLFKMKRERYALVTLAPATWLVACTTAAGLDQMGDLRRHSPSAAKRLSSIFTAGGRFAAFCWNALTLENSRPLPNNAPVNADLSGGPHAATMKVGMRRRRSCRPIADHLAQQQAPLSSRTGGSSSCWNRRERHSSLPLRFWPRGPTQHQDSNEAPGQSVT